MMAARAGARHVYTIEDTNVASYTERIIRENKLDSVVTVIRGDVISIRTLPCIVVDMILCDWREKSLLVDTYLRSVIHARNMFLRGDGKGVIIPDMLKLQICGVQIRILQCAIVMLKQQKNWFKMHQL